MRIPCPYCGERDVSEFSYLGDGEVSRPDPSLSDAPDRFADAVYLRKNPAGLHSELWFHGAGCRAWLRVSRSTISHEIFGARLASLAVSQ